MSDHLPLPIAAALLQNAQRMPDRLALECDGQTLSVDELACKAINVAEQLSAKEFPTGTLAVSERNSPEFVVLFFAANLLGLNLQVFNPEWPEELRTKVLRFLQPDCYISREESSTCSQVIPVDSLDFSGANTTRIPDWKKRLMSADRQYAPFYTGFTSGSSGLPKGFVRSEMSWLRSFEKDGEIYGLTKDDRILCPGSFAHSLFLYALLRGVYAGIPVLVTSGFRPGSFAAQIASGQSGVLFAVPSQLQAIAEVAGKAVIPISSVRLVLSAGAKLHPKEHDKLRNCFSGAKVSEFYGSSELGYISLSDATRYDPAESVGHAFPGVEITILNEQNQTCATGDVGRVFVKSPLKFLGYAKEHGSYSLDGLNSHGDFFSCGDTGWMDENGCLFLSGRSDRMINISGRNSFPENIEAALLQLDGIRQVAVFSEPDELRGERPVAVVQLQPEIAVSRSDMIRGARQFLADYEIPRKYFVRNDWPLTVSHKTDLQTLQAEVLAGALEILQ